MIHHSVLLPESSDSSIGALGPVLFGKRRGPCVSIYLPAQSSSFTVMRRKLRFARLVEEAKRLVIEDHGEDFALEFFSGFWRRKPFRLIESETQALAFFHDASFRPCPNLS